MAADVDGSEESARLDRDVGSVRADRTDREPLEWWGTILTYLGPALATLAITIGSGELITTTATGAQLRIVALWILLFSLLIKTGIQYVIAKYAMVGDKTPHRIFDELDGSLPESILGVSVERVDTKDGFKIFLVDGSWLVVRPSGTEPMLRAYAEADSEAQMRDLLAAGRDIVEPLV